MRTLMLIVFVTCAIALGCGLLVGIDSYRACDGGECANVDGGGDESTADGPPSRTCTTSADCVGNTGALVCSSGSCTGIKVLGQGLSNHSCVVLDDGTVRCWGHDEYGQLGDNAYQTTNKVVTVLDQNGNVLDHVIDVGMAWDRSCALTSFGNVYCWGRNEAGMSGLGDPDTVPSANTATAVSFGDKKATQLSVGLDVTCALMTDHTVYCWGEDDLGQQADFSPDGGPPAFKFHATPTQMPVPPNVIAVGAGGRQACVQTSDESDKLTCWGDGWLGALANGNPTVPDDQWPGEVWSPEKNTFVVAKAGLKIDQFRLGEEQICARVGVAMYCWGGDYFTMASAAGGGGGANYARVKAPLRLGLPPVTDISPSWRATCALISGGSAQCWGDTDKGGLGTGNWDKPLRGNAGVVQLTDAIAIAEHVLFGCALVKDGHVYCWGQSDQGVKLGDGVSQDAGGWEDEWQLDLNRPVAF